ncbi:MAG: hypothetical protein QOH14_3686 [Pseudonocardiales bacterium]|nr:hypothetical protein [Pseudonocardiales bacterium]
MSALVAISLGALLGLGGLTGIGSRRRGDSIAVFFLAAALFPVAWTAWYVRDVMPHRNAS